MIIIIIIIFISRFAPKRFSKHSPQEIVLIFCVLIFQFFISSLGRKTTVIGGMIISGFACITVAFLPNVPEDPSKLDQMTFRELINTLADLL